MVAVQWVVLVYALWWLFSGWCWCMPCGGCSVGAGVGICPVVAVQQVVDWWCMPCGGCSTGGRLVVYALWWLFSGCRWWCMPCGGCSAVVVYRCTTVRCGGRSRSPHSPLLRAVRQQTGADLDVQMSADEQRVPAHLDARRRQEADEQTQRHHAPRAAAHVDRGLFSHPHTAALCHK